MKITANWSKISERISSRTGLTDNRDIEVYAHFCKHADSEDGVIMYGDVQHEIYRDLCNNASKPMRVLETAYNESSGNGEGIPQIMSYRLFVSPMSRMARNSFAEYYHKFIELDLVRLPVSELDRRGRKYYPTLNGYNYYNDPEFISD
jgi:hypothetical protein